MENTTRYYTNTAAVILAVGLALGGFFPGFYYYQSQTSDNTVSVKGLAERNVIADLAVWEIKFVATGNDLPQIQKEMEKQKQLIMQFLADRNFHPEEISDGRIETNDLMANPYRSNDANSSRFIVTETLTVRTTDVYKVATALTQTGILVSQGIIFDSQNGYPVSYIFTKLNDIKPQMLQEATQNARQAALEFAKSSGSGVGKIHRANQGVFSILPQDDTPSGIASQQIHKKIRVVSTIEYFLE